MSFSFAEVHSKDILADVKADAIIQRGDLTISDIPFLHGHILNFAGGEVCNRLLRFCEERVVYKRMKNDLYDFEQSEDIASSLSLAEPNFIHKLLSEFPDFLRSRLGFGLNDRIHLTSSRYSASDYLLCHNDLVGNGKEHRKIAFVYYVKCPKRGGSLDLFDSDPESHHATAIIKSIIPLADSLSFFEVTDRSYHQVSEVLWSGEPGDSRISIHGWFHSNSPVEMRGSADVGTSQQCHQGMTDRCSDLQFIGLINPLYLDPDTQAEACEVICSQGAIMIQSFLTDDFFADICDQLPLVKWNPLNEYDTRRYDVADEQSIADGSAVNQLIDFFKSKAILITLSNLSGIDLDGDPARQQNAGLEPVRLQLELRRVTPGSYSLLGSAEGETGTEEGELCSKGRYLWTCVFFGVASGWDKKGGGQIVFARNNCEDEVVHVDPDDNSLSMVLVDRDVSPFLHYCKASSADEHKPVYYQLVATYRP